MDVFVSVATGLSAKQEEFVSAIEARLRAIGLAPCTIGRNTFSSDAPLRAVTDLMDRCAGAVVIALERYRFLEGDSNVLERPQRRPCRAQACQPRGTRSKRQWRIVVGFRC